MGISIVGAQVCSDKLLEKDSMRTIVTEEQRLFDFHLVCISTFSEFNEAKGGDGRGSFLSSYGFGDGGVSYNEHNYERFKRLNCLKNEQDQHHSAMQFYSFSSLKTEAIAGYVECMRQQTFSCWAKPQGSYVEFVVYRGVGARDYTTQEGVIIDGNVTVLTNPYPAGAKILLRQQSVAVRRNDSNSIKFLLNVSDGEVGDSCGAYILAKPKIIVIEEEDDEEDETVEGGGITETLFSYESKNAPWNFIRHYNQLGHISPSDGTTLFLGDATWYHRPGLANSSLMSLESRNNPGWFLRHQYNRIKISMHSEEQLFKTDATWYRVKGLADPNCYSFQAFGDRDSYIRHRQHELWLDRFEATDLFRNDATFCIRPPLLGP